MLNSGVFIKFLFSAISGFAVYNRLLDLTKSKLNVKLSELAYALAVSLILSFINNYTSIDYLIFAMLFILFLILFLKQPIETACIFGIVSFGVCFAAYSISCIVIGCLSYPIISLLPNDIYDIILDVSVLATCILQLIICCLIFKIKRFRKGMPFLKESRYTEAGVFISVAILLLFVLINAERDEQPIQIAAVFFIILSAVFILLWWQNKLRQQYILKIRNREIKELSERVDFLVSENDNMKNSNDTLSEIIHKDNKLISAMILAVQGVLQTETDKGKTQNNDNAVKLLDELKGLYNDRKAALHDYEISGRQFSSVGFMYIDGMIAYLYKKSQDCDVEFDFSCDCDLKSFIDDKVTETDFCVFLAEMGTNALISAKYSDNKSVLCRIAAYDDFLRLDFYDSGENFDLRVIENFGKKRITTHKKTGGSGIGLTTVNELAEKINASIKIDETVADKIFTKCVSVYFDNKGSKLSYKTNRYTAENEIGIA